MPLTSRSRSTARPPTARPAASNGRPESVVSVMTKPRPSPRKSATACSICWAASGSSQAPKASTRSGRCPSTRSVVSPRISGWSSAAAQVTSTCGSDSSSCLNRSTSACSVAASSRAPLSWRPAWRRLRISTTVVSTAKQATPANRVKVTTSWRSKMAKARLSVSAPAGDAPSGMQRFARAAVVKNPRRLGRERGISFAVRTVSGISELPQRMR